MSNFELMGHYIDRGMELIGGIPPDGKIILAVCVMILTLPFIRHIYANGART
jgi:hypothetical protein